MSHIYSRVWSWLGGVVTTARAHMTLAIIWTLMIVPTLLWWRNSVLFVAFVSLYANVVAHLGAYKAAQAAKAARESR